MVGEAPGLVVGPVDLPAHLRDVVLDVVAGLGGSDVALEVHLAADDRAVVRASSSSGDAWVVRLAAAALVPTIDLGRTAHAQRLAGAAGVPVPDVVLAGRVPGDDTWQVLVQVHAEGTPWREVAPGLDRAGRDAVHRELAGILLALRSVRPASFGDLAEPGDRGAGRGPAGADAPGSVAALAARARLRIPGRAEQDTFLRVLDREAALFAADRDPVLTHDDLHHGNVLVRRSVDGWRVASVLDWDKAWAGPADSDLARVAFWDHMTGPAFWQVYRAAVPEPDGWRRRALVHQLLWCLEYPVDSPRHRDDTARVLGALA